MVITGHVRYSNVARHYVTRSFSTYADISGNCSHRHSALSDQLDTPKKNNGKLILLNVSGCQASSSIRTLWVCAVSGGPYEYTAKSLHDAHLDEHITPDVFDEVAVGEPNKFLPKI